MADACARCGLPFREGEGRHTHGFVAVHPSNAACIARLTAVARAAEAVNNAVDSDENAEMEADDGFWHAMDRLRAALAGGEPRE